jgi:UDP-4-amino-4,6-dideoxy-N-acetyl-beta-L-altrosamine N-acetyltransferase
LDDTHYIIRWRNDENVKRNLYSQSDLTEAQHLNWFHNQITTGRCSQFIIEENCLGGRPLGTVFIKNIDKKNQKGEFGIFIGEAWGRGKGYASLATALILDYAFKELKLNRVYLTVFCDNLPAIKAYERVGFVREGLLRQDYLRSDGFVDVVYMGITAELWD